MPESQPQVQLLVGLGNPGRAYEATRHNAGFWFLDALAHKHGCQLKKESRYHAELCRAAIEGQDRWLCKPTGFMNLSGQSVAALANFYKIPLEAILVAHDDLDLPPGAVRLKRGGGNGGHNGLRDIDARMGGRDYLRLRIGIGHPGHRDEVTDYVLSRPSPQDRELIEAAIADAIDALPLVLAGEMARAMNRLHAR